MKLKIHEEKKRKRRIGLEKSRRSLNLPPSVIKTKGLPQKFKGIDLKGKARVMRFN